MIKIILNKNSGNKIQNILFDIIYIFIMAFIVAAWNGKTINDMIFIYKTVKMEIILKIFLEIGGVIYFIVYSIFPIIIYQWIFTKKRKRERKKIVS
jgi:hypothetical protein